MKDQNPFRDKLYNHTLPVREEMWKNIEATLPSSKRRFPFLWFAVAGLLLFGTSTIALSLLNQKQNTDNFPATNNTDQETNKSITSQELANPIASSTENSTTNYSDVKKGINAEEHTISKSALNTNRKNPKHITFSARANPKDDLISGELFNASDIPIVIADRSIIDITNLESLEMLGVIGEDEVNEITAVKPDPSCYKFRGANGKNLLSFDVFGGPGIAPRTFEATEGETSPYALARNETESGQYAWGAGARMNLNLQQGFAVRLGIMYEQIGDKFNYTDPAAFLKTTSVDSFFAADGSFLYADTNVVLIFGKLIKKIHNRYTHIDIPLLLSYELPLGRSTFMINAGPVLNLTSSQRGQILDPALKPVHITQGEPDELKAYKNNLGLSVYVGAGALFPVTDNISALIEPRFLYRINPVTLENYPLKEHRSFAGLNLGLRYHFN